MRAALYTLAMVKSINYRTKHSFFQKRNLVNLKLIITEYYSTISLNNSVYIDMLNKRDILNNFKEIEYHSDHPSDFASFLNNNNSNYLAEICIGKKYLPTPNLLADVMQKNIEVFEKNKYLRTTLEKAIEKSQVFYEKFTDALIEQHRYDIDFNSLFEHQLQSHGQDVVNNLHLLQYYMNSCAQKIAYEKRSGSAAYFCKTFFFSLKNFLYKPRLLCALYIIFSMITVIILGGSTFYIIDTVTQTIYAIICAAITGAAFTLFSIANFKIYMFESRDIMGENLLAYKYRSYVNLNKSNAGKS